MKEYKDIKDDQIRIIGEDDRKKSPFRHPRVIICLLYTSPSPRDCS